MSLRSAMPDTAAAVDWLREQLGRELVDAAIKAGMTLQRQYEAHVAEHGVAAANAWLDAQSASGPVFYAQEITERGAMSVGALPGCAPQPLLAPRRGSR